MWIIPCSDNGASWIPDLRYREVSRSTLSLREFLIGYYGEPGTSFFKIMVRDREWKYLYIANGGREQLFHVAQDANELYNRIGKESDVTQRLRDVAIRACVVPGAREALNNNGLRQFPFKKRKRERIYQFDKSRGIKGFPARPQDALKTDRQNKKPPHVKKQSHSDKT